MDILDILYGRVSTDVAEVVGSVEAARIGGVWRAPVALRVESWRAVFAAVGDNGRRRARVRVEETRHIVDFVINDESAIGCGTVLAGFLHG